MAATLLGVLIIPANGVQGPVERIRILYEKAREMEKGESGTHSVTLNTVLPAIGLQTTTVRFVYESRQVDPRRDPYLLERRLVKTVVRYNIAASVEYTIEYLYDEKERLVFHFRQERSRTPEPDEKRFYFREGKLLRVDVRHNDGRSREVKGAGKSALSRRDREEGNEVYSKGAAYLRHFRTLVELEKMK